MSAPSDLIGELRTGLENASTGPYEGRDVRGMGVPAGCVDFGVISLSTGREVHRSWAEADARFAAICSPDNIRILLDHIASLEAENARLVKEAEAACNAFDVMSVSEAYGGCGVTSVSSRDLNVLDKAVGVLREALSRQVGGR